MRTDFRHQKSAGGWQISSPGILGSAALIGALKLTREAGIEAIRGKSLAMTSYLIGLVDEVLPESETGFRIGSPRNPEERGGHVALEHPEGWRICEALKERGVVPDFRPPEIIRVAPVALYNTFHEVWRVVRHLKEIHGNREFLKFSGARKLIS